MNQADAAGLKELIEEAQEDNKLEFKKRPVTCPRVLADVFRFRKYSRRVILLGVEENDPRISLPVSRILQKSLPIYSTFCPTKIRLATALSGMIR